MVLLDTNVLSDSLKLGRYPKLKGWLAERDASELFISSISLAEIAYGVNRLADGYKKQALVHDLKRLKQRFARQTLAVDAEAALIYGEHHAKQLKKGYNDNPFDSLIIASALKYQLIIATRNVKHFQDRGVIVVNPYA